jgi:hypothetical protein
MVQSIDWPSANCHGEPLLLVLDVYKGHRTAKLRQRAGQPNAELLFVPAGGTSHDQPLDRRVFGERKSRARHARGQLASRTAIHEATPEGAIGILISCWAAIPADNIRRAWEIAPE